MTQPQSIPQVLAEVAYDLALQGGNAAEWQAAFGGGPISNEAVEAYFDTLEGEGLDGQRAQIGEAFRAIVNKATHNPDNTAHVVFGYETDAATRQRFVDAVELRTGPLDWTFDTNHALGGGAIFKRGDTAVELTGQNQVAKAFKP